MPRKQNTALHGIGLLVSSVTGSATNVGYLVTLKTIKTLWQKGDIWINILPILGSCTVLTCFSSKRLLSKVPGTLYTASQ